MGWVIVQFVLLGLIAGVFVMTPSAEWGLFRWVGVPFVGVAGVLLLPSLVAHGRKLTPFPKPNPELGLLTKGVYAFIRHPIYAGLMALVWGLALLLQKPWGLVGAGVLTLFFNLKARAEERFLRQHYPEYAEYQQRTGRFLPRIFS